MATNVSRRHMLHPVHAVLLASSFPLFLGALLSDWAYSNSYVVQWLNLAAWLNAGALVFAGLALLWALIDFFRADRDRASALYLLLLLATFIVGFINALVHGMDAWATMPEGLILSIIVLLLALGALWAGFSSQRAGVAE